MNWEPYAEKYEKTLEKIAARKNIQTYGNRDRPNVGINRPGGGRGQSPTGGDVSGTPFARGGLATMFQRR